MRNITAIDWLPTALRTLLRKCGAITASSTDHGTAAAISARNTSRFVYFFLPRTTERREAQLPVHTVALESKPVCYDPEADQRFLSCEICLLWPSIKSMDIYKNAVRTKLDLQVRLSIS